MAATVLELKAVLKHHPDNTVVAIEDVDEQEFAIVDFLFENNKLTIVIGTKEQGDGE